MGDAQWPDFYVDEDVFSELPLSQDQDDVEGSLAREYPMETSQPPGHFERLPEQLRWMSRVLQHFRPEPWQVQNYNLQLDWYTYRSRCRDEMQRVTAAEASAEILDPDAQDDAIAEPVTEKEEGSAHESAEDDASQRPQTADDQPQLSLAPPEMPDAVPQPQTKTAISVRQLLGYLCLGKSPTDGLTRLLTILSPSGGDETEEIPAESLYAATLQLGARPTPPSECDTKPFHPAYDAFYHGYGSSE